jgi:hypothetical protein
MPTHLRFIVVLMFLALPSFQQQCHSGGISDCLNREHERPGLGEQKPLRLNRLRGWSNQFQFRGQD